MNPTGIPGNDILVSGRSLAEIAARHGTPCYVYSGARIQTKQRMLANAAAAVTPRHRLFYAMKANRNPFVLGHLRSLGLGVDTCSGDEVRRALEAGWDPKQISMTSVALNEADVALLARTPEVTLHADSVSQMTRIAQASPGRSIGLRVNPRVGFGYNEQLEYAAENRVTKFGIYLDAFDGALRRARDLGLRIGSLHCHSGWGLQHSGLSQVAKVLQSLRDFIHQCKHHDVVLDHINLGGGLGTPLSPNDVQLNLSDWAKLVREHLGDVFDNGTALWLEPGDFLVRDSGLLVTRVLAVEEKCGITFATLDASFAVNLQSAAYGLPMNPIVVKQAPQGRVPAGGETHPMQRPYRLVGSINEAVDVFVTEVMLPELQEGDLIVFSSTGAYGASMSSQHCLRGQFTEIFLP